MLLRRSALEEVGLFDERYWMYMEDLDLCYRFKEAGWTTWYEPSVTALHVKHGTSGDARSIALTVAFYRGMARFVVSHPATVPNPATRLFVLVGIACVGALRRPGLRRALSSRRLAGTATPTRPCRRDATSSGREGVTGLRTRAAVVRTAAVSSAKCG